MSAIAKSSVGTEPYWQRFITDIICYIKRVQESKYIKESWRNTEKNLRHFAIKYFNVPFRLLCSRSRRTRSRGGSRKPASTFLTTLICTRSPRARTATALEPVNDTVASKYSKTFSVLFLFESAHLWILFIISRPEALKVGVVEFISIWVNNFYRDFYDRLEECTGNFY